MISYFKLILSVIIFVAFSASIYFIYHDNFVAEGSDNKEKEVHAPNGMEDSFLLGQYYFNTGDEADGAYDLAKARTNYLKSVTDNPKKELLAWHQLGRIDFLEGKFDDAIYNFNKQIEYFGDELPNVYYMLGLTYGYLGRAGGGEEAWAKAEENFHKYLEFDPTSPWARVDLSWIYFTQGKYESMLPILEVGLVYEPANPWLLNMYGLALMNLADAEKAHKYFLWAKTEAARLTVEDWGKSYPGNSPDVWPQGLSEFKAAIDHNIELTSGN